MSNEEIRPQDTVRDGLDGSELDATVKEMGSSLGSKDKVNVAESNEAIASNDDVDPDDKNHLPAELKMFTERLAVVGVRCLDVAFNRLAPWGDRAFNEDKSTILSQVRPQPFAQAQSPAGLAATWQQLAARLSLTQPVAMVRYQNNLVVGYVMSERGGELSVLGCLIGAPYNEKTVHIVQLALGWLQMSISTDLIIQGQHASRLLELLGYVFSQEHARSGVQEWINRTAAWARSEAPHEFGLALNLFTVKHGEPKWWVSSDIAWTEHGSPIMQSALEIAAMAIVEMQEQTKVGWWAVPLIDAGVVQAVLVVRHHELGRHLPPKVMDICRSSGMMAEPVLRQWTKAERPWWRHSLDAMHTVYKNLTQPGHLVWKMVAGLIVLGLAILLLWPVNDLAKGDVVIEGSTRWVITAPTQGFISQVMVRPGDPVKQGQLLANIDDRDVLLEQAKQQSAVAQAEAHLRQAMGEDDAAASGQAAADLSQAQAQLHLAETKLLRMQVTAPMDGIVVSGDWAQQVGSPIDNGKELFEIASDDGYRVVLHILDEDIGRLKVGQQGTLKLTSLPSDYFRFQVSRVTPIANVESGKNGFRVEAKWIGKAPHLSPGMQGVGKVIVGRTNLWTAWTRPLFNWLRLKIWSVA
jgi:biotin carboxyl carrier protein